MKDDAVRVLVVDDDESLTEVYAAWLDDAYHVETATSGAAALDALDQDVGVVLLDRRMPDLTGGEVLETIRAEEYDCRVAMVTGVRPDENVIDMGFDEYLLKPVDRDDLHSVVDRLMERLAYDDKLQEHYSLAAKRAALTAEATRAEDPESVQEAIRTVDDRLDEVESEMDRVVDAFAFDDFRVAFRDIAGADDD